MFWSFSKKALCVEDLQDQALDENATRWDFLLIHFKITFIHT